MRRRSRSSALQLLYQLELNKDLTRDVAREPVIRSSIARFWHNFETLAPQDEAYAERVVLGVARNLSAIDDALADCSRNWRLSRMDKVDLSILRLAAYELLFCPDVPRAATLNEAIELGKLFSGNDSASFINGILDQLAPDKPEPAGRGPDDEVKAQAAPADDEAAVHADEGHSKDEADTEHDEDEGDGEGEGDDEGADDADEAHLSAAP